MKKSSNSKGMLIVLSGPSGAGKGTVCRALMNRNIPGIELSVSATSRKPRPIETEGVSYFFKTREQFEQKIKNGELLEYAQVFNNYYGTPKKYVENKTNSGVDVILEIDIQGAMQVKEKGTDAVFIFIMPPTFEELKKRIRGRGTENDEDIKIRMKNAYKEVSAAENYDYIVVNEEINDAVDRIISIIKAEKCKYNRVKIDFESFKEE